MRFSACLVSLMAALLLSCSAFAQEHAPAELTKISESVYAYANIHSGTPFNHFGANVGVVIGTDSVLVIDTLTSAKEAAHLVQNIRTVTDKPIRYVVNTHSHLDHTLGNNIFADMGAILIAQEECRSKMLAEGPQTLASPAAFGLPQDFWEGTRITPPAITFAQELDIDLGSMPVKLVYSGHTTHSAGSVYVLVPSQQVIFTGDILFTDFHPFLGEGDLKAWPEALDAIAALHMKYIIPGHGPLSTAKDIADMKAYLALFDSKARELSATMTDPAQISAEMLKIMPPRNDGAFIVGMNIGMRYCQAQPKQ